jgi:hypothetical protein
MLMLLTYSQLINQLKAEVWVYLNESVHGQISLGRFEGQNNALAATLLILFE